MGITFEEKKFRKTNNIEDFKKYINNTVIKLYDISRFPMFMPIGGIRLKKYSIREECYVISDVCKITKTSIQNLRNFFL